MNNCGPATEGCEGDAVIDCRCMCDNCESHYMECEGCERCTVVDDHQWVPSLDPRWLVCAIHSDEALVKI